MRLASLPIVVGLLLATAVITCPASPARAEDGTVTLTWTAPGDDSLVGTASAYDLRYYPLPITPSLFNGAFKVTPAPVPQTGGKRQSVTVHGLIPSAKYYFAIRTVDDAGNWSVMSNVVMAQATYTLGVGDPALELDFSNPFPNPSRAAASFTLALPAAADVDVQVFDVTGRHVRTLMSQPRTPGRSTVTWDLRDDAGHALGSGLYLVRARVGDRTFVRRVTVAL